MAQSRRQPDPTASSAWPAIAGLTGLAVMCFAFFVGEATARTLLFWYYQDDYIRTEMVITEVNLAGEARARIATTGENVPANHVPSPARGKVVPIWYAQDHGFYFNGGKVQYVSEFETPPSASLAFGIAAVNLAIFAVGALLVAYAVRSKPSMAAGAPGRRTAGRSAHRRPGRTRDRR